MITLSRYLTGNVFRRFPRGVWLMMGLDTLLGAASSLVFPFLALYLHNERGLPMSLVGTVFLVGGLVTGGTNLIGGMLSDRFGRRRLMLGVISATIFMYGVLALLIGFSTPVWLIAVVYVVARGIAGTINPTIGAMVADLSPQDRLAESYAVVRIGGNVGFAVGPAVGGFLVSFLSYGWLLAISAVMYSLTAFLVFFIMPESFPGSKQRVDFRSTLAVAGDRPFLVFTTFSILLVLAVGHLGSTLSIFAVDWLGLSTAQYGLLLTTNGIGVVLFQYPATYFASKLSKANGLILGSLFYVVGWASLGWVTGFNWAVVSLVVITAGEVTLAPISSAVVAEAAPPDKRGRYMGFFALSQTLGWSLSPLFGGVLLDVFPAEARLLWGIIASAGIIAAIGFYGWGKMARKRLPA